VIKDYEIPGGTRGWPSAGGRLGAAGFEADFKVVADHLDGKQPSGKHLAGADFQRPLLSNLRSVVR
jgi:hypothetical protein